MRFFLVSLSVSAIYLLGGEARIRAGRIPAALGTKMFAEAGSRSRLSIHLPFPTLSQGEPVFQDGLGFFIVTFQLGTDTNVKEKWGCVD
jgi:hypothetical protein